MRDTWTQERLADTCVEQHNVALRTRPDTWTGCHGPTVKSTHWLHSTVQAVLNNTGATTIRKYGTNVHAPVLSGALPNLEQLAPELTVQAIPQNILSFGSVKMVCGTQFALLPGYEAKTAFRNLD